MTTTQDTQRPPLRQVIPGEAFIIAAPEDADARVWQAVRNLEKLTSEIAEAYARREWARGDELLKGVGDAQSEIRRASVVVQHGDLNVVELLLRQLRDGEWHNLWSLESKLTTWDWRLGEANVQDPTDERDRPISAVWALVYLWRQPGGRLKEHGGRAAFRLKKPGEK